MNIKELKEAAEEAARKRPNNLSSAILSLIARVEQMEEALRPFARLGEEAKWLGHADDRQAWGFDNVNLMWGDFRKARHALETPANPIEEVVDEPSRSN